MTPKRDTSRHSIECACEHCTINQTGLLAQCEVLRAARTKVLTPRLCAVVVALCAARGSVAAVEVAA